MNTRQQLVVNTDRISAEGVRYLREGVAKWRREGATLKDAAARASVWAGGYRAHHAGCAAPAYTTQDYVDGFAYAKGETAYWMCMQVDAAQYSYAAAGGAVNDKRPARDPRGKQATNGFCQSGAGRAN